RFSRDWSSDVCSSDLREHSTKLFAQVFQGENATLTWDVPNSAEIKGRINLFTGAYMAFRNARAHREKDEKLIHQYREFLLINERSEERRVGKEWRIG